MPDRWVVALAGATALGALRPSVLAPAIGLALAVGALLLRRPALLCLAAAALASSLAARSLDGLRGAVPASATGPLVLLTDPEPAGAGVRAEGRWDGRHVEVRADGSAARALAPRLAGERVVVRGRLEPMRSGSGWALSRHLAARLQVHRVDGSSPGPVPVRVANGLRRTLVRGAASLPPDARSLFTGLVVGDDRAQPLVVADDFRGAGMTHLLAVSGQNVAFVLALAGPALRRLRLWPRLVLTLAVVGLFGLVTRFEPSVARAAAMAAIAATTTTAGHPIGRLRVLALAVTALLLVDPLLVHAVGFRLSVAAAASIVVVTPRLALALPGPAPVREALAVTIAAQLAVAPLLLATFGPVPVASVPANLLAVPAAGLVMAWGMTAGLAAGVVGGAAAAALHVPTHLLLRWLEEVAHRGAALPLGELRTGHVLVAAAGLALAVAGRRRAGFTLAAASVVVAALGAQAPPPLRSELAAGAVRWHSAGTDVLGRGDAGGGRGVTAPALLSGLRRARVGGIDLLVVADGAVSVATLAAVADRHPIGVVVAPPGAALGELDAPSVPPPWTALTVPVGHLEVRLTPASGRLVVEARPAPG